MGKVSLVFISDAYTDYMVKHCYSIARKRCAGAFRRPYILLPERINGHLYCVPLTSPKCTDYVKNEDGSLGIRKDCVTRVRLDHKHSKTGELELIGCVFLNKMIPVPESELEFFNPSRRFTQSYEFLLKLELKVIKEKIGMIVGKSNFIYRIYSDVSLAKLKEETEPIEFDKAEAACVKFMESLERGLSREEILATVSHLPDKIVEERLPGGIPVSALSSAVKSEEKGAVGGVEVPVPQPQKSAWSKPLKFTGECKPPEKPKSEWDKPLNLGQRTPAGVEESLEGLSLTDGAVGGARPKCPRGYDEGSVRRIVLESRGGRGRSSSQSSGQPTQQVMGRGRGRGRTIAR